jgi:ferredoxin-NADP reductase
MTEPSTARLVAATDFDGSRLLRFEMSHGKALGFRGGQYIIVDTGLTLPDGKRRKRAFSLLSSDLEQHGFELAVRHVEGGLGSEWMLSLAVGAELSFSGPWGKLTAPEHDHPGPIWILATDSGVTAALGLLRSRSFQAHLPVTHFRWWAPTTDYLLHPDAVLSSLPGCKDTRFETLPAIGSPQRLEHASCRVSELAQHALPSRAYLIGDGHVITCARERLTALGVAASAIQSDSFFHHAVRKASSTQAA